MHVTQVTLTNFTSHDKSTLKLPAAGVVVITGENGAGKSSFVEGVAWGGWGKTLRGTRPWRGEAKPTCSVSLTTATLGIARSRTGGKNELEWGPLEEACEEYETPTKAQEALVKVIGPFDLWRRSHVFSSADAAHFTLATDSERKRLIETFLGNDRFDPAFKAAKADLLGAEKKHAALALTYAREEATLEGARTRLADAKRALASAPDLPEPGAPPVGKSTADFDATLAQVATQARDIRAQLRAADGAGGGFEVMERNARALIDKLRAGVCPTCALPVSNERLASLKAEAAQAHAHAQKEKAKANVGRADLEAALEELEEESTAYRAAREKRAAQLREHGEQVRAHRAGQAQRKVLEQTLQSAGDAITNATTELEHTSRTLQEAGEAVGELTAAAHALSPKGFRAQVLAKSLGGISAVANTWLARFSDRVRVSLRPYSEQANGDVDDSISIEVAGAGDGLGYKAASGGERRRIDIALLLALAEVAAAARGQEAGTMWADEMFDCLDDVGAEAVAEGLRTLAQTRAVVVVTHSKKLVEALAPVVHYHVECGTVRVV